MKLESTEVNVPYVTSNPRGGLEMTFDLTSQTPISLSETWSTAGWDIQFIRLGAHQTLELPDAENFVKVITGKLENIGRTCFAKPFAVRSTKLETRHLLAGSQGVFFALLTATAEVPDTVTDMSQCQFIGPGAGSLDWLSFEEKFGEFIDAFNGLDCHMANGFHLLDAEGSEVVYVNFWTCGKGVDLSTHNHAQDPSPLGPAFAEVHWVFNNGTEKGGMYETDEPGTPDRMRHPMLRGDEHGPYFDFEGGKPTLRDNGAVQYPWHGWQGGEDDTDQQTYDFVAAFEINPAYAHISR